MKRGYLASTIVLLAVLTGALPVAAQSPARGGMDSADRGLDRAVSQARKKTGGRVLSAETRRHKGRPTHFVRILTDDGRVRRLRVDAETGQPLKSGK